MTSLPVHVEGEGAQAAYHVIPDAVRGGWNVYATNRPQEPQEHFASRKEAIAFAETISLQEGVGFTVEGGEAPARGR